MIVSPIIVKDLQLTINYPDVDCILYRNLVNNLNKGVINCLENILKDIKLINKNNNHIKDIYSYAYVNILERYYWYLLHIDNYILYNEYLDKLIVQHKININDFNNNIQTETIIKTKKKSYNTRKNVYVKHIVRNIFTGAVEYEYINHKTEDKIISDNPNLLETLNAKPKKEKKKTYTSIPLSSMTFSFTKNK